MSAVTEKELAEVATGERVTMGDIEKAIYSEHYFTAAEGEVGHRFVNNKDVFGVPEDLELLMFCVLVLWNGFTVVGQSACADRANFNETIGRRLAKEDAVKKIWPLMGFSLKTRLAKENDSRPARMTTAQPVGDSAKGAEMSFNERLVKEHHELSDRFKKLDDFLISDSFGDLRPDARADLCTQYRAMDAYVAILTRRIAKLV